MRSPGSVVGTIARTGAALLLEAREHERLGRFPEAIACYEGAITAAERTREPAVLVEALRRLAVLEGQRDAPARARELCRRSYREARHIADTLLAAEALNTLGGLDLTAGALPEARREFLQALELGGPDRALRARVEQNLGILANIQGQLEEALSHYRRSLEAYHNAGDQHGCAIAYHNLGMISADRGEFDKADRYFQDSRAIAERLGDTYLQGLCLVNHAEVDVARQRFENARQNADAALAIFDQLGARGAKADAYRVIGMMYRDSGRPALAEVRFRSAIELAVAAGSVLGEAEASRELAILYQTTGRNQDTLTYLNAAYRLFRRLDAKVDLVHVGGKVAALEGTYLAVVRAWGQSIESSDSDMFGHCERVARHAVAVARVLGLDEQEEKTILLGAYLHDVGLMRVPHEILSKPGPLTRQELDVVQQHPLWGIELLANVEFPWDIKPIIRWHHEHVNGSGYPDRLHGDQIPLSAQIVGIAEAYDALTTARVHQPALPADRALQRIAACRTWWSPRVYEAFVRAVTRPGGSEREEGEGRYPPATSARGRDPGTGR